MLKDLKAGDKAWLIPNGEPGREVEITKTGRKYVYFLTQRRANVESGDVHVYSRYGNSWPSQGRLFKSELDTKETIEAEARWYDLVSDLKFVKRSFRTIGNIKKVREILGLEEWEVK